jgi:hypothetical protein
MRHIARPSGSLLPLRVDVLRVWTTAETDLPDRSTPQPKILPCGCELRGVLRLLTLRGKRHQDAGKRRTRHRVMT